MSNEVGNTFEDCEGIPIKVECLCGATEGILEIRRSDTAVPEDFNELVDWRITCTSCGRSVVLHNVYPTGWA